MLVKVDLPAPEKLPDSAEGLLETAVTAGVALLAVGFVAAFWVYYSSRKRKSITSLMQIIAIVGIAGGFTLLGTGLGRAGIPEADWRANEMAAVQGNIVTAVESTWNIDIPPEERSKIFTTTNEAEVMFGAFPNDRTSKTSCKLTNFLSSNGDSQRNVEEGRAGKMQLGLTCDSIGEPKKR